MTGPPDAEKRIVDPRIALGLPRMRDHKRQELLSTNAQAAGHFGRRRPPRAGVPG